MYNAFKGKGFHSSGNGRKSKDTSTFICRVGSAGFILIYDIITVKLIHVFIAISSLSKLTVWVLSI